MSEVRSRKPLGPAWFAALPPTLLFGSASVLLASVRFLYARRVVRYRALTVAFRVANALCRIGMASWRLRSMEPPGG